MELTEFLSKQEEIYERSFRSKVPEVLEKGLLPDPVLTERHGGYFIFYKHGKEISRKVADVARMISAHIPCVPYTEGMIHTTCCTLGVGPGVRPESWETIEELRQAMRFPRYIDIGDPSFDFREYLVNRTTVILRGIPTASFPAETEFVANRLKENGLDARLPWGAHITVARFAGPIKNKDTVQWLVKSLKGLPPVGKGGVPSLHYGMFAAGPASFTILTNV